MTSENGENRLYGWLAIAGYLEVSENTARSYFKELELPVRRLQRGGVARYSAFPSELDEWRRKQEAIPALTPPAEASKPSSTPYPSVWLRTLAAASLIVLLVTEHTERRLDTQPVTFTSRPGEGLVARRGETEL